MKPIVLKADTALLRALIEADPELRLQISASVLKNVSDDAVNIAVMERLKAQLQQLANFGEGWNRQRSQVNPFLNNAFHNLLEKMVARHVEWATEELVTKTVTPAIEKVFEAMLPEFQKQIDAMIDASFTSEHLRARLESKLAALKL